ncbi:uncharacterized protein LOC119453306 isoform X2 [Dermacentor silvarum]|uniref:uncharacterized protein LOC119453306 isoform X2 n=1 Tax=Dermacentor silvarum TaxID=543639 RepID=UPI00210107D1|nr:uncharacterized protein LOC119453306 isoform X2 [Dermacentor silvarum]
MSRVRCCPTGRLSAGDVVSKDNTAPSPMAGHNRDDCFKFELPPSFGISCDTLLENKRPVTAKVRRHIVSVLFKACCKMTLYPTNRLYNRVLDSLVTKYPHVVEGKYDRRRWLIALKSRFKTARQKLPESTAAVDEARKRCGLKRTLADADGEHAYAHAQHMPVSQKSPPSSSTNLHVSQDKPSQRESGGPDDTSSEAFGAEHSHTFETTPSDSVESCSASDSTESRAESKQPEEEESLDCPDYSDAVLEDVTDSDLLGMCTDEAASETLMAEECGRASPDKRKSCEIPAEEVAYYTRAQASPDKSKNCDGPAEEVTYYTRAQASPDKSKSCDGPAEEVTYYMRAQVSPDKSKSCDIPAEVVTYYTIVQASPDKRKNCDKPVEEVTYYTRVQDSPEKRKNYDKPAEEVARYTRSQASPDKRKSCDKPAEEDTYYTRAQASPAKRKSCDEPAEEVSRQEVRPSPHPEEQGESSSDCEPDCEDFKLPSFGIFDDLLRIQVPVNTLMQRTIISKLFDALCKDTLYPSAYQYDVAVHSLLKKYPHLSNIRGGKTGKFWRKALKAKFNTFRTKVAGSLWKKRKARSKYGQVEPDNGASQHISRPLYIDVRLSEDNDEACEQSESEASAGSDSTDYRKQVLVAKARHVAVRDMTVEKAISTYPTYREESSLLGEFNILWKADIADCFEKGIKKLFLILMNCGTNGEIQAMSKPGNDILMAVLNAIARRCGERLGSILIEGNALATPCLVMHVNKSVDVFVNSVHLFTASSLLGGLCALFASFWVFHIKYSQHAKGILTFLEHAFLDFNYTTPQNKCERFINLYRRGSL